MRNDHFCEYCSQPMKEYQLFTSTYWACPLCEAHGRTVGGKVPQDAPPRLAGQAPSGWDHTADRGAGPCFQDKHTPNLTRHQIPKATAGCACGHFKDILPKTQAVNPETGKPLVNHIGTPFSVSLSEKVLPQMRGVSSGRFSSTEPNAWALPRDDSDNRKEPVSTHEFGSHMAGRRMGKTTALNKIVEEWMKANPAAKKLRVHDEFIMDYSVGPEEFRREYLCEWTDYSYRKDDVVLNDTHPIFTARGGNGRWNGPLKAGDTVRLNNMTITISDDGQYRLSARHRALTIERLDP